MFLAHRNRSDFCDLRLRCPSRTPEIARFPKQEKAMPHCDLRVRWKVASDLRFRAAISEPKTPSFCGISGDLAPSTRKSLAIAIVRFWCAKALLTSACGHHTAGSAISQVLLAPRAWEMRNCRTASPSRCGVGLNAQLQIRARAYGDGRKVTDLREKLKGNN